MPRFYCDNTECPNYQKEVFFVKINYKFDKQTGELVASEDLNCKECGKEMVQKKTEGYPQLLKFDSLSEEDKRKIIHKRAQKHFEKVGRHQKEYIKRQMIKRYTGR